MSPNIFKFVRKNRLIESLRSEKSDPFLVQEGRFQFGGLKDSYYHTDWTEGSFLADTGQKEMLSLSFRFEKLKYLIFLIVIAFSFLLGRSFFLQVSKNDYYSFLSEGNRLRAEVIEPKRGIIYTKDLEPLVRNTANFVVYFKPIDLPSDELERDELLRKVSKVLSGSKPDSSENNVSGLSVSSDDALFYQFKDALSKVKRGSLESYQPLFAADNIPYERAMLLELQLLDWPGVFLSTKIRREYLQPNINPDETELSASGPSVLGISSLSHILGYTGKID